MFRLVNTCRLCGRAELTPVLDLGEQHLTGVFPANAEQPLTRGPLALVRCGECGLVQLRHSYQPDELYGAHYGYRSSLNASMVAHLRAKAEWLQQLHQPEATDCVVDIGANDGTFLGSFPTDGPLLVGFDPSAEKFRPLYRPDVRLHVEFFSAAAFRRHYPGRTARLVTSIAMFYDLEDPLAFVRDVAGILHPEGLWHVEQSYLPTMLQQNAYDTICHEHLEYYGLAQLHWMAERAGLKIVAVSTNDVNGGSFAVTLAHAESAWPQAREVVAQFLAEERVLGLEGPAFAAFADRVRTLRDQLIRQLRELKAQGKRVFGYGASTKGNVILQYAGITPELLPCIAEVNPEKFGHVTPGTHIPIISEAEARAQRPDYFLVFPWHFRAGIVRREAAFLAGGGRLIFPLPNLEIVAA